MNPKVLLSHPGRWALHCSLGDSDGIFTKQMLAPPSLRRTAPLTGVPGTMV